MSFPDELENCNDYDPSEEIEWSEDTKRMFQGLKLLELVVKRIKQIEDEYPIKGEEDWQPRKTHSEYILLQSLLDDSTKNEEV